MTTPIEILCKGLPCIFIISFISNSGIQYLFELCAFFEI